MAYEKFDRSKLEILPLSLRKHKMGLASIKELNHPVLPDMINPAVRQNIMLVAQRIVEKSLDKRQVVWMMGAHVLRRGNSRFIIDLMKRGIITHVATNMAAAIHDFELSYIGATLEDVEFYIRDGRFGNWQETGSLLNQAVAEGYKINMGLGQSIARMINLASDEEMPNKNISIFNTAYEMGIPITVHKGIGYDITDQHPAANFEAIGKTSGDDFLAFAATISKLENGIFLNLGSAVMGPEVYLKALSMARNLARQQGKEIRHFTTAVFDIMPLGNWKEEERIVDYRASGVMSDPRYYFRPLKSILVRTVKDGGESFYIHGDFDLTVPCLYRDIINLLESTEKT